MQGYYKIINLIQKYIAGKLTETQKATFHVSSIDTLMHDVSKVTMSLRNQNGELSGKGVTVLCGLCRKWQPHLIGLL
jgi:hypothetical protein